MRIPDKIAAFLLLAGAALQPATAWSQTESSGASEEIKKIIYSDLSKSEILDQLSAFVSIGDKLEDFPTTTGVELGFCLVGGPGVVDCHLANGLQLVADPDGLVQVIRRDSKVIDGKSFSEMSISTHILHWNGYARGYPE